MTRLLLRIVGLLAGCFTSVSAFAINLENATSSARPFAATMPDATMNEYVPTLAPFAHVVFCQRYPSECRTDGFGNGIVEMTPSILALLHWVNQSVNHAIKAQPDVSGPLGDIWTLSPVRGDCDDYAVTKRSRLAQLGFPLSALRLAIARTVQGEGHAILIVRTDRGNMVLDNRTPAIRDWKWTGLRFLAVQSGRDPHRWFAVTPTEMVSNSLTSAPSSP